ncbi:unnamed protein product, partial [Didymodactylos carnosus]
MASVHLALALFDPIENDQKWYIILPSSAVQSGDFNSLTTWGRSVVPEIGSTVIIPDGVTVYISDQPGLAINISSLRVYGRLQIGSSNNTSSTTFTFQYPINIMIFNKGVLQDLTSTHRWFVLSNTIITIYIGGSFISSQSTTLVYSHNNSTLTLNSIIYGSYTITIDLRGKIQTYP